MRWETCWTALPSPSSWEMAPRFLCSWSTYPVTSIPVSCCFGRREQPSTSSTTGVPSPASRGSGQSRRAESSQKLPLGRAGSSSQSPCEHHPPDLTRRGFSPPLWGRVLLQLPPPRCLQRKHSHPQVGSAPAPPALVPSGAGRIAFRFIHDQVFVPFITNCPFLGDQAHIQLFSRKTGQDLAPSTSAQFLGLLTPPSSLHGVAQ